VDFLTSNFSACFSVIISSPIQLFTVRGRPCSVPVACLIKKNLFGDLHEPAIAAWDAFRYFPNWSVHTGGVLLYKILAISDVQHSNRSSSSGVMALSLYSFLTFLLILPIFCWFGDIYTTVMLPFDSASLSSRSNILGLTILFKQFLSATPRLHKNGWLLLFVTAVHYGTHP